MNVVSADFPTVFLLLQVGVYVAQTIRARGKTPTTLFNMLRATGGRTDRRRRKRWRKRPSDRTGDGARSTVTSNATCNTYLSYGYLLPNFVTSHNHPTLSGAHKQYPGFSSAMHLVGAALQFSRATQERVGGICRPIDCDEFAGVLSTARSWSPTRCGPLRQSTKTEASGNRWYWCE